MDPMQNPTAAGAAQAAGGQSQAGTQAEFDKVLGSLLQGVMSTVMEEMQQIAMTDDSE